MSVVVNRPHGHIWTFPEVDAFVDSVLLGKPTLVRVGVPVSAGGRLTAPLDRASSFKEASLCYTLDSGPWQKRQWQTTPARVEGRALSAELPGARPLVAFLVVTDETGARISSEHVELAASF